jgi:hypothetical protein
MQENEINSRHDDLAQPLPSLIPIGYRDAIGMTFRPLQAGQLEALTHVQNYSLRARKLISPFVEHGTQVDLSKVDSGRLRKYSPPRISMRVLVKSICSCIVNGTSASGRTLQSHRQRNPPVWVP